MEDATRDHLLAQRYDLISHEAGDSVTNISHLPKLSTYREVAVGYIVVGLVARMVARRTGCPECRSALSAKALDGSHAAKPWADSAERPRRLKQAFKQHSANLPRNRKANPEDFVSHRSTASLTEDQQFLVLSPTLFSQSLVTGFTRLKITRRAWNPTIIVSTR